MTYQLFSEALEALKAIPMQRLQPDGKCPICGTAMNLNRAKNYGYCTACKRVVGPVDMYALQQKLWDGKEKLRGRQFADVVKHYARSSGAPVVEDAPWEWDDVIIIPYEKDGRGVADHIHFLRDGRAAYLPYHGPAYWVDNLEAYRDSWPEWFTPQQQTMPRQQEPQRDLQQPQKMMQPSQTAHPSYHAPQQSTAQQPQTGPQSDLPDGHELPF